MNLKITFFTLMTSLFIVNMSLYAQNPTFEWVKQIGGNGTVVASTITPDLNGYLFVAGQFSGTSDLDPGTTTSSFTSNGYTDVYIQKLDGDGNLLWVKKFGGLSEEYALSITTDAAGNVYTSGIFAATVNFNPDGEPANLTAIGSYDTFITKHDTNGNFQWVKHLGGIENDYGYAIRTDSTGGVYICGFFRETVDFDPGEGVYNVTSNGDSDMFLLKLDTDGDFIWMKQIGGVLSEYPLSIALDSGNNIYMTGDFKGTVDFNSRAGDATLISAGNEDIFVLKIDGNGDFIWVKQMGGKGVDKGTSISVDAQGNVYTTGHYMQTVDFDPGEGTYNMTTTGSSNIFVQKLDTNGNFLWANYMGGLGSDAGTSITNDADGNVIVTGNFYNQASFDSGAGNLSLTSHGNYDMFIQKFDSDGQHIWLKQMGGSGIDNAMSTVIDASGKIYTVGYFQLLADFNIGESNGKLTSNGGYDGFIQKLSMETMGLDSAFSDGLKLYPNPTKGDFSVTFKIEQPKVSVRLLSITGQVLMEDKFHNTKKIDLELHQPNGLYFLEILDHQAKKTVMKIVKD
ncbi:SBBP repeat-containing protein [Gelidibacter gilvus]|uniref:T9SS type A sorting domain-containing protein n=1 Tax=Gelidibacter gilvus TaxID=59602 RepID=A0A4Q0XCQ4_9FLAO|nr:SBBP repeat-containing protein [Gelidibacter gilvus]RXJ45615.1 T9SS type A sorting domain-containing protein [Gelidibacter gilvus]